MLKLISWNIAHCTAHWDQVIAAGAQIALLQEACEPPTALADKIGVDASPWKTGAEGRPWRTCVAALDRSVPIRRCEPVSLADARDGQFAISRFGTLAAAEVTDLETHETLTVISMYAPWERPHEWTRSGWIYADASAHRLISDLSVFVGSSRGHRIVAAGDFNILHGYGEGGNEYWGRRYQTVFDRMEALGLRFVGPQAPNGIQANPRPTELPVESGDVPTFRTNRKNPDSATRQLDFVFASESIASRVTARAVNRPEEWGPSDHCMVRIQID